MKLSIESLLFHEPHAVEYGGVMMIVAYRIQHLLDPFTQ